MGADQDWDTASQATTADMFLQDLTLTPDESLCRVFEALQVEMDKRKLHHQQQHATASALFASAKQQQPQPSIQQTSRHTRTTPTPTSTTATPSSTSSGGPSPFRPVEDPVVFSLKVPSSMSASTSTSTATAAVSAASSAATTPLQKSPGQTHRTLGKTYASTASSSAVPVYVAEASRRTHPRSLSGDGLTYHGRSSLNHGFGNSYGGNSTPEGSIKTKRSDMVSSSGGSSSGSGRPKKLVSAPFAFAADLGEVDDPEVSTHLGGSGSLLPLPLPSPHNKRVTPTRPGALVDRSHGAAPPNDKMFAAFPPSPSLSGPSSSLAFSPSSFSLV